MIARVLVESLVLALLGLLAGVVYMMCFREERPSPARAELAAAQEKTAMTPDREFFLTHDGRQRRYLVHVPQGYDGSKPLPVVLGFHGGMGRAEGFRTQSRLNEAADRFGFLMVYPDGTGRTKMLTWNAVGCCGYAVQQKVDDVGFIRRLLDDLPTHYAIDARRVYATGMSNGAMFSYRLAHELADRIAAIGPVAGGDMARDGPRPTRPVPVVHIHGKKDPFAHFLGGKGPIAGVPHPSIPDTIAWWVKANHCQPEPVEVKEERDHTRTLYAPAPGTEGAPVLFYVLPEGGHAWPGGVDVTANLGTGKLIAEVDADALLWEFFAKHSLPAPAAPGTRDDKR